MKEKKNFAQLLGKWSANLVVVCVTTCVWSVLIALTYKLVSWILGVII